MLTRILAGGCAAAVAGAAMLAISATSASAFTMSSPSLAPPVASANIDKVYWHHWRHHHRHCWRGRYHWHCRYW